MITLDNEILVLDRSLDGDDILPLVHTGKGGQVEWYIDLGIADEAVKFYLVDAEILDEEFPIRYIARDGKQAEAQAQIEELISDEEGDRCRLRGVGKAPAALLADGAQEA